ncbi:hypothetical protein [Streptomyces sp. NPDC094032]|uniref:hypothetical protein n=1 Tax=Streptomyces sp. NPDC094032 TaxID=3155308 RepID=UPI00331F2BC6
MNLRRTAVVSVTTLCLAVTAPAAYAAAPAATPAALPSAVSSPGSVAFADFNSLLNRGVSGRVTLTEMPGNTVRLIGQFDTGFDDHTANWEVQWGSKPRLPLMVNPPATAPFTADYPNTTLGLVTLGSIKIYKNGALYTSTLLVGLL